MESNGGFGCGCRRFFHDDDSNSAMEYAIMLGLIGVTLMPVVQSVGDKVSSIGRGLSDTLALGTGGFAG